MSRDESLYRKIKRWRDTAYTIFSRAKRFMYHGPGQGGEVHSYNNELPMTQPHSVLVNNKHTVFNPGAYPESWSSNSGSLNKKIRRVNGSNHSRINRRRYMVDPRQ